MSHDAFWALVNVAVGVVMTATMVTINVIVYHHVTKPFRRKGDSRPRGGAQSDF